MGASQSNSAYCIPLSQVEEGKGETPVYRNIKSPNKLRSSIERLPAVKNMQDLQNYIAKTHAHLPCMGTRYPKPDNTLGNFEFKTFGQIYEIARKAGAAITNLGLAPPVEAEGYPTCKFLTLYSKNREEWGIIDIASCLYGYTTLAIYDTLGPESIDFVFEQTNVSSSFCSGENLVKLLKGRQDGRIPQLKNIVCFDSFTEEQKNQATSVGASLISWTEFLSYGEQQVEQPKDITADSIFTLSYTSGTTALPKAVMISQGNLLAFLGSTEDMEGLEIHNMGPGDGHISYLPLAHILERAFFHIALYRGAKIGFSDALRLKDDMPLFKPTMLISVPRVYNKLYDGIKAKMAGMPPGLKKKIADNAVNIKLKNLRKKGALKHAIFDPIVFAKTKELTGGRVKFFMSGSAPISSEVTDFLKIAFCAPLFEGYGQTETCAAAFGQVPSDTSSGNVGGPLTCVEFKLKDVPDMKYTALDKGPNGEPMPRGEICMRGPSIFVGYYKDAEKTKETIDETGWHHSGDIGVILPNGALKLVDRKKNIFKLAQGEYVAPEKVEQIYLTNKYVAEIYIYGDSFQTFCIAIIVPEPKQIMKLAEDSGLTGKTLEEVCKDQTINQKILEDLNKTGKGAKLFGFEMPKAIHLEPRSFMTLDLTTPSMKVKRTPARDFYMDIIKEMYANTKVA